MTPFTLSHPDHMRLQRQGWMCSVLFHAIMGTCALVLLSGLQMPLQQDQFSWNVAMVEPPKPQQKVDAPSETKPRPAPPKPQIARTLPPQPQPIVETIQQRLIQPVQEVRREMTRTVHTAPLVTTVTQAASVMTQAVRHSETNKTTTPAPTREVVVQEEQIVTTAPPVPQQTTAAVVTGSLVSRQALEPVVERAVVEPAGESAVHQQQAAVEQAAERVLPTKTLPATKADYGWLMQALLGRVNQLKNYPHLARVNHWEGTVVLRAVIKDDGQVLMVDVQESSGRPILDNDAIETLRRASPLKLEHPLGKPQVVIQMPIGYSLR